VTRGPVPPSTTPESHGLPSRFLPRASKFRHGPVRFDLAPKSTSSASEDRHRPPTMSDKGRVLSFAERRGSSLSEELILDTSATMSDPRVAKMSQSRHVRGPPTPSMSTPAADFDQQLMGSPPPPPTPAASPGPSDCQPDWSGAADDEDFFLAKVRQHFKNCSGPQRTRILADLLNLCTSPQLSFVHQFVSPLLKKDPFTSLPDELCLRVSSPGTPRALLISN
jgi:F-box and WD-40 domain protein CDC4